MKDFKPTNRMINASEAVVQAQAVYDATKEIVVAYETAILKEMDVSIAPEWIDKGHEPMKITEPQHTYLMTDSDFQVYLAKCRTEQAKAGLVTESPEHCPLLVAEDQLRKANQELVDSFEHITGVSYDKLVSTSGGLANYDKYIDLTMRLMAGWL